MRNANLSPTLRGTPSLVTSIVFLLTALLSDSKMIGDYIYINITNSFGHAGGSKVKGEAKALLVVIILILIIPAVGLVFTGGTSNSTGVYTNSTVANNARTGITQFSQFIGIAMILGVVGVIVGLVG